MHAQSPSFSPNWDTNILSLSLFVASRGSFCAKRSSKFFHLIPPLLIGAGQRDFAKQREEFVCFTKITNSNIWGGWER